MEIESYRTLSQYDGRNGFLLCAIVAKRIRQLEDLMPGRQVPELVALALRNCMDQELKIDFEPGTPEIIRQEAIELSQMAKSPAPPDESSADGIGRNEPNTASGPGLDGSPIRPDSIAIQRADSSGNPDGTDSVRVRELRVIARNLCLEASQHEDKRDYLVAYGLYGRALTVLEAIHPLDPQKGSLVRRIHQDQQRLFEMLRAGSIGIEEAASCKSMGEHFPDDPAVAESKRVDRVHAEVLYEGAHAVSHPAGSSTAD